MSGVTKKWWNVSENWFDRGCTTCDVCNVAIVFDGVSPGDYQIVFKDGDNNILAETNPDDLEQAIKLDDRDDIFVCVYSSLEVPDDVILNNDDDDTVKAGIGCTVGTVTDLLCGKIITLSIVEEG